LYRYLRHLVQAARDNLGRQRRARDLEQLFGVARAEFHPVADGFKVVACNFTRYFKPVRDFPRVQAPV
jgi:hypothetical protein